MGKKPPVFIIPRLNFMDGFYLCPKECPFWRPETRHSEVVKHDPNRCTLKRALDTCVHGLIPDLALCPGDPSENVALEAIRINDSPSICCDYFKLLIEEDMANERDMAIEEILEECK